MAKCSDCGKDVLNVRDDFTGSTFPVDPEPVRMRGFTLKAAGEGERAPRAVLQDSEVYRPHSATCARTEKAQRDLRAHEQGK